MTDPTRQKIDTRGSPSQQKALVDAVEIAHGARVHALRDVDRALDDELRTASRYGHSSVTGLEIAQGRVRHLLAQSDRPEQGS